MEQGHEQKQPTLWHWCLATVLLTLAVALANVLFGPLNQDEGWYLYAAQNVSKGLLPHRDFFFTQGTLMPCVYAAFEWAWAPFGLLGGRLLTLGFALLALALGSRTLHTLTAAPRRQAALLLFWCFLGLNLWYTYFTAIPKAYALCTLGIALVLGCFARRRSERLSPGWLFVAGFTCALLADIRLSMGVLLPTLGLWLLLQRAWAGKWGWIAFAAGGTIGLALLFLPELLLWREGFMAAQRFHAARDPMGVLGMAGCLARWIRFNPLLVGALLLLTCRRTTNPLPPFAQLCFVTAGALLAVHLLAPVPYDDYAIPAFFPLAMGVAHTLSTRISETTLPALAKGATVLALLLTVIGAPLAQEWFVLRQDRFWVEFKSEPDLFRLRRAGAELRAAANRLGTDTVWTQDTYLAVEAGLRVPPGLEMGPFSPPLPLTDLPPLAAWSGYTFALSYPTLTPAPDRENRLRELQSIYNVPLLVLPDFGQAHTTLTLAEKSQP